MNDTGNYQQIIKRILLEYAAIPYSYGKIERKVVVDRQGNDFFLVINGWDNQGRVHGIVVHVEIKRDKVWIQRDGIEDGITDELVAAGIPKNQIVLGFHHPNVRPHTEYAVF